MFEEPNQETGCTSSQNDATASACWSASVRASPAFIRIRERSQDTAVMNNARQLASAADQYFLENGVTTVTSTNMIGTNGYVKAINTVASEAYPANYTMGVTITISGVAGARTVTFVH